MAVLLPSLLFFTVTWGEFQMGASTDVLSRSPPSPFVNYIIHFEEQRPNYVLNRIRDVDDGQITFDNFGLADETRSVHSGTRLQNAQGVLSGLPSTAVIPERSKETSAAAIEEQSGGRAYNIRYINHALTYASQPRRPCCSYGRERDLQDGRIIFPGTSEYDEIQTPTYGGRPPFKSVNTQHFSPVFGSSVPNAFAHNSFTSNDDRTHRTTTKSPPTSPSTSNGVEVSANVIPKGPSRCVWAIISCCTRKTNEVRHHCFELLGCEGSFWDTNPCENQITDNAVKVALDFYNEG